MHTMKRVHIHAGVADLDKAIAYYSALFGSEPVKVRSDYAKWAPEDLAINFAVSLSSSHSGISHLGIEYDTTDDVDAADQRVASLGKVSHREEAVSCCYAKSDKAWVEDPGGTAWELFHTHGESDALVSSARVETRPAESSPSGACCG
jgi:catechol 2,3-dioxygenase-like lactoylglutathione lyase family enzyme